MDLLELGNPKTDPAELLNEFHKWMLKHDITWIKNRSHKEDPILDFSKDCVYEWIRKTRLNNPDIVKGSHYDSLIESVNVIIVVWCALEFVDVGYQSISILEKGCDIVGEW